MPPPLTRVLTRLRKAHGKQAPKDTDPLAVVVRQNVAYLVSEERRDAAFEAFVRDVGLDARAIASASDETLQRIGEMTGGRVLDRVAKLRRIAEVVLDELDGDLDAVLQRPTSKALRALQKFPGIGAPGAEKILLLAGRFAQLPLDSNGLRVLQRLGYAEPQRSYAASYAAIRAAIADQLPGGKERLVEAHLLLQTHGRTFCKNTRPQCDACPVAAQCDFAAASRL